MSYPHYRVMTSILTAAVAGSLQAAEPATWQEHAGNPVIGYAQTLPDTVWNDPSVMKEGETYRMWLSGGNPTKFPISVRVYQATSTDGQEWTIYPEPLLEPDPDPKAWDSQRIETPSVIRVNGTYHLYYSGCDAPCNDGIYAIGHATSPDGKTWTKDPRNPILKAQSDNPLAWGYYSAAEPGIVYHPEQQLFYLYYVSAKARYPEPGSSSGILVATSKDGSRFTVATDPKGEPAPALTLSENYPRKTYRGYSTPMAYLDQGVFHLYYDVVMDPEKFQQVALAHAVSSDGLHFKEIEWDLVTNTGTAWHSLEVRAPTVLVEDGLVKMWFAGHLKPVSWSTFQGGIGYAEKNALQAEGKKD